MTLLRAVVAVSCLTLLACAGGNAARVRVGDKAPDFSLESTAGGTARLADYSGRTVVLAFYPKAFTGG